MKVHRLHKWGKKTVQFVTFIAAQPDPTRPEPGASSSEKEVAQRVRQAEKRRWDYVSRSYVHPAANAKPIALPVLTDVLTTEQLMAKYGAEIEAGRAAQKRMFGSKKGVN
jgi:hypothetical protein